MSESSAASRIDALEHDAAGHDAGRRRLVGVQFRQAAAVVYDFDAGDLELAHGTRVVVETDRGEALGWTVGAPEKREPHTEAALKRVLRVVSGPDQDRARGHARLELEALKFFARRVREQNLPAKAIAVDWSHSGEKAAFYFSSEERVEVRPLVRELAQRYRVRVEMRQVGPRDEAKIIGAIGVCGRETCCSTWLRAFTPVTIRMARDQGLALTQDKVTGVCGRLLCCLAFEQDTYRELRRKLPRLGKQVMTPRGQARVVDLLVLRGKVRVEFEGQREWVEFDTADLRPVGAPQPHEADEELESVETATDGASKTLEHAPRPPRPEFKRPRDEERADRRPKKPMAERMPEKAKPERPKPERNPPPPAEPKADKAPAPRKRRPKKPKGAPVAPPPKAAMPAAEAKAGAQPASKPGEAPRPRHRGRRRPRGGAPAGAPKES